MKYLNKTVIYSFLALLIFASCKKNNIAVDKDPIISPSYAEVAFADLTPKLYSIGQSGNTFSIPIGVTSTSSVDRTVQISYTSTTGASNGTHFNAPTTLTLKSGQAVSSLTLSGIYSQYSTGRIDSVKVKLTGGDVNLFKGKDSIIVVLQQYCDVVLPDLAGDYANTNEYNSAGAFSYGPYTASLTNVVSTGATTATASLVNLYDDGWNDITCTLDWTNPASFKLTIPLQPTGKAYGSATATSVRTSSAKASTFSSCNQEFQIYIDLVDATTGVASTSGYKFYLKR